MPGANPGPIGLRTRVAELASNPNAKILLIGATAVAATPIVLPLIKPALKTALKTGLILYEKAKIAFSETGEFLADAAAEARAEVQEAESKKLASLQVNASVPESTAAE